MTHDGTSPRWMTMTLSATLMVLALPLTARAHGGGGTEDHLSIGYYYGHDGSFENPASPPWPATLLVDTHPWELDSAIYPLTFQSGGILTGWASEAPGFSTLDVDDQEFGGHGYYSWKDPAYTHGDVDVVLHVDQIDTGLQMLNTSTLQPITSWTLGSDFHTHPTFFVDESVNATAGDVFTATFHLSDNNGSLADSEPFTVQFQVVPEPATAAGLLVGSMLLLSPRPRRRS